MNYILRKAMQSAGIPDGALVIDADVWANIVRPLGYDAGIRTLERTIEGIVRKVARAIVEGRGSSFHLTALNIKEFLPQ
jgi:ATP-dependent Lon protease